MNQRNTLRFTTCSLLSGLLLAACGGVPDASPLREQVGSLEVVEANARLIAAAPDLLESAKLLHKWFEITGSSINARWDRIPPIERKAIVDATRAAIAKAEGR